VPEISGGGCEIQATVTNDNSRAGLVTSVHHDDCKLKSERRTEVTHRHATPASYAATPTLYATHVSHATPASRATPASNGTHHFDENDIEELDFPTIDLNPENYRNGQRLNSGKSASSRENGDNGVSLVDQQHQQQRQGLGHDTQTEFSARAAVPPVLSATNQLVEGSGAKRCKRLLLDPDIEGACHSYLNWTSCTNSANKQLVQRLIDQAKMELTEKRAHLLVDVINDVIDAHIRTCRYTADAIAAGLSLYEASLKSQPGVRLVTYLLTAAIFYWLQPNFLLNKV